MKYLRIYTFCRIIKVDEGSECPRVLPWHEWLVLVGLQSSQIVVSTQLRLQRVTM